MLKKSPSPRPNRFPTKPKSRWNIWTSFILALLSARRVSTPISTRLEFHSVFIITARLTCENRFTCTFTTLLAEILHDLAMTAASVPPDDPHRKVLGDAAKALFIALDRDEPALS